MKKVLAITCILVLVALVSSIAVAASSAENNWRFKIRTDNGSGGNSNDSQFGVYPTSTNLVDSQDASYPFTAPPGSAIASLCTAVINNDLTKAYTKDVKAPFTAPAVTVWDLRIGALGDATYANIGVKFLSFANGTLPPAFGGTPYKYSLKMVDNKGVEGAPSNNTVWDIVIPTTYSTTVPFFTLTLPKLNAGYNAADFNAGAYKMELKVEPAPEPSGLLALGAGMVGLVGFVARRRRA